MLKWCEYSGYPEDLDVLKVPAIRKKKKKKKVCISDKISSMLADFYKKEEFSFCG